MEQTELSKYRTKGLLYDKCKHFSLSVIQLYNELVSSNEFVISKQLLRSSTSIGANYSEALGAESDADFLHKISISRKEIHETLYWLELLRDSSLINEQTYSDLSNELADIFKMTNASISTIKQRIQNAKHN